MISNEEIRQEVIDLLQGNIQGIQHFHNGRAVFTDVENELPAIAVFIDEAEYSQLTLCDGECNAYLKIGIYLPMFSTENDLDLVAQKISDVMNEATFRSMDECVLAKYSYDYDANESAWKTATLHYNINYLN
ncbi:phage tail terminator protein [Mannheimia haemolytica]